MTVFYTEHYEKRLTEKDGIINLSIGETFVYKEKFYEVVFKLYNVVDNIMVYHGKSID